MIKEKDGKFYVYSKTGKKLSDAYDTREEAKDRLRQIEYFQVKDFEDAEYQGKKVTLNAPFRTSGESKKFAVYARNGKGNVVKVRFGDPDMEIKRDDPEARKAYRARHKCDTQKDKSTPAYWSCRMWGKEPVSKLTDCKMMVGYDAKNKTITSVRDGVQEYLGVELGVEPLDKTFTVFRDASTITSIVGDMAGLPTIEDHIDVEQEPTKEQTIGIIGDTEVIEYFDDSTSTSLMLQNKASFSDKVMGLLDSGKRYLSLGYKAKMREHDVYDFEQYDIEPRHLAIVDSARGGSALTFLDKGKKTMHKAFLDADGNISIQKVAELAADFPEAVKQMDIKELQKIAPKLMEIVEAAKVSDKPEEEMEEEEMADMGTEKEIKVEDEEDEKEMSYSDADVKKMIETQVKMHAEVSDKARSFLPETYGFADKSPNQIMRDTLAQTNPGESFADNELSVAFKMLRTNQEYSNFADSDRHTNIDKIFNEEI